MQRHIDLVGLLYVLAAALTALVAVAVCSLGLGALSIAWWPETPGSQVAASVAAATFVTIALLLAAWASVNAWVGYELRRVRRPVARLAALTLAVLHLFVLPFGTALGVYSLWVLLHHESRAAFESAGQRLPHA